MFNKLLIFCVLMIGTAYADQSNCEKLVSPGEFYKADLEKCLDAEKKSAKILSVHDSLRESGKEVKNSRAPSVEVMYGRSTKQ